MQLHGTGADDCHTCGIGTFRQVAIIDLPSISGRIAGCWPDAFNGCSAQAIEQKRKEAYVRPEFVARQPVVNGPVAKVCQSDGICGVNGVTGVDALNRGLIKGRRSEWVDPDTEDRRTDVNVIRRKPDIMLRCVAAHFYRRSVMAD